MSLFAWLFTPIFQSMFIIMTAVYQFLHNLGLPGAIAWAIVVLTLVVRAVLIPLYRKQLVSQRRMQLIQPELREIHKRFKGDNMKAASRSRSCSRSEASIRSPGACPCSCSCPLLFIMYSVIRTA